MCPERCGGHRHCAFQLQHTLLVLRRRLNAFPGVTIRVRVRARARVRVRVRVRVGVGVRVGVRYVF